MRVQIWKSGAGPESLHFSQVPPSRAFRRPHPKPTEGEIYAATRELRDSHGSNVRRSPWNLWSNHMGETQIREETDQLSPGGSPKREEEEGERHV